MSIPVLEEIYEASSARITITIAGPCRIKNMDLITPAGIDLTDEFKLGYAPAESGAAAYYPIAILTDTAGIVYSQELDRCIPAGASVSIGYDNTNLVACVVVVVVDRNVR